MLQWFVRPNKTFYSIRVSVLHDKTKEIGQLLDLLESLQMPSIGDESILTGSRQYRKPRGTGT